MSTSPSPAPEAQPAPPLEMPHHMPHPVERERKRVRLACSNCHRGKIKCDGDRPCDRCIKKGLHPDECVDFQRKRTACTSCRAVKMKCDGNRPCKRCLKKGKGEECTDVENTPMRRPRPERGIRQDAGMDEHRPVPYNYDVAAETAYYYPPPPWAYPMPGAPWQPYGAPPHVYPYGPPPPDDERQAQYTPALRSSYENLPPGSGGPIDPALDPALAANGPPPGMVAAEGWRDIINATTMGSRPAGYYAESGGAQGEGGEDGEGEGEAHEHEDGDAEGEEEGGDDDGDAKRESGEDDDE